MISYIKSLNKKRCVYVFLIIYFIINLIYLTKFPFVHSDEPWLSGLSRNIVEHKSYSVTETFFDLYVRNPHAIKIIFHTIQVAFIEVLGYSIFNVRLISLIFGTLSLLFFYKLCSLVFQSERLPFVATVLLSLDIQFIYASHFARQEIVLVFILILGLYYFFKHINSHKVKNDMILGIIIGLSIGIHPNSFIISLPFISVYIYNILITNKLNLRNLIYFGLTLIILASFFVALSYYFDSNFIHNYLKYGEQFGVLKPASSKLSQLKYFYLKLFYGVSGTYYTPNIKFQFFLFGSAFLLSLFKMFIIKDSSKREKVIATLLSIVAINIGILLIGRYNQTSIVFIFPLFYMLIIYLLDGIRPVFKNILIIFLSLTLIGSSIANIQPYIDNNYDDYLYEISKAVDKNNKVLANLNCEYYFNNGKLHDYRNLGLLKNNNMSFEQYIHNKDIEYIIYSEEMDYIYKSRPIWNGLYGNVAYYYADMQDFFENNCELVYEFEDKTYGMRLARFVNKEGWKIKIFKVMDVGK